MAYQIPSKVKALVLLDNTTFTLFKILPLQDLLFKHAVVTMYIKGLIGADFKMRINIYQDDTNGKVLLSSLPINNLDIPRTNDLYTELRFDFPKLGNILSISKPHLVEFEIYDGYVYDTNNFVSIIFDAFGSQNYLGSDTFIDFTDAPELCAKCAFFFENKQESTEKFFMCRLQGAKLLNGVVTETEIQFFPARKLYTMYMPKGLAPKSMVITNVNFGGYVPTTIFDWQSDFTPTALTPDLYLNKFYYNPVTGLLKVYTNQVLNDTCYGIFEYYLFFTDTRGKYYGIEMDENNPVYWQPRLPDKLTVEFSQENNLQGLLSISASSINLKNQDQFFNAFFSVNDCFSNRQIKLWSCVGDFNNKKVEFIGVIRGADLSDTECVFTVADPLASLDNMYRDNKPFTLIQLANAGLYTIRTDQMFQPVPRVLGKISSFSMVTRATGQSQNVSWMSNENMIECLNVNYIPAFTTANNRTWSCGFGPASAATQQRDVTAVANFVSGTFSATKFTINNAAGPVSEWLPPGTCIVNNGIYGIVYASTATEAFVWPHNAGYSAAFDIIRHKVISVIVERSGNIYYPKAGEAYTCQIGAAGDIQIVFANNFEALASVALGAALNPMDDKVYACFMNDDYDARSSQIVKNLLVSLGLEVNAQFESPEAGWIDPHLAITVPFPGDSEFPSIKTLVEMALRSSMSAIYFDDNGHLRYKSFMQQIQGAISDVVNESGFDASDEINQTNSTEFNVKFDLWDLFGGVQFTLTHCADATYHRHQYSVVQDFYKTTKICEVETVIDPTRANALTFLDGYAKLVMGRSAVYSIKALSNHVNMWLGDDVRVSRKALVGSDTAATLRVVSINRDISSARFSLKDLKKFPSI